jgi:segregation and condensation protein B
MSEFETENDEILNPEENHDLIAEETQALMNAEGLTEVDETEAEVIPAQLEPVQARSILESVLLASDKPLGMAFFKEIFKGTNIKTPKIKEALEALTQDYAGAERGLSLVEVGGGFQLRTKNENSVFVRRMMKGRPFKLSGPALEVLSIIAYKQPIIKAEVDEIRGVESGHLMRALMDRGLIKFDGKSELPGKPMLYGTTRKFLEIFGLKDIRELPSLSEIDQLLPDGIGDEETENEDKLGDMQAMGLQYQADPERDVEWEKISHDISEIKTTTDYFENEKERQRKERDEQRAESIRERIALSEEVDTKDLKWLARFEAKQNEGSAPQSLPVDNTAAETSGNVAEETFPVDPDAVASVIASDSDESESVAELESETAIDEQGRKVDAGKLSEILEGLKSKNSLVKQDSNPSEREHLNKSVYRPDQLAQALKDFDSDEEKE